MFPPEAESFLQSMMTGYFDGGQDERRHCLIDDEEGDIQGFAYYQQQAATDRVWDLTMIAVQPRLQGSGRGTALLRQFEENLRKSGQRLLLVETSATAQYDRTRTFYRQNAYDEEARIRDYWEARDDLVVFRKDLGRS